MAKKTTKAEITKRIETVKAMLYQGLDRSQVLQYSSKQWGVSNRTVDNYIASARDDMQEEIDTSRPFLLAEHIASRRDIRRRFRKAGDLHGELKAMQDEAKLLTLYEHHVTIHTWRDEVVEALKSGELTPDDVRELYPDLAADFFRQAGVDAS